MKSKAIHIVIASVLFSFLQLVSGEVGLCNKDLLLASGEELAAGVTKETTECTAFLTEDGTLELTSKEDGTVRWESYDEKTAIMNTEGGGPFVAKLMDTGKFMVQDKSNFKFNFIAGSILHRKGIHTYSVEVDKNCIPIVCRCVRGVRCRQIW